MGLWAVLRAAGGAGSFPAPPHQVPEDLTVPTSLLTFTRTYTDTYAHTHTYTHIHIYTYTHTHTLPMSRSLGTMWRALQLRRCCTQDKINIIMNKVMEDAKKVCT